MRVGVSVGSRSIDCLAVRNRLQDHCGTDNCRPTWNGLLDCFCHYHCHMRKFLDWFDLACLGPSC